MPLFEAARVYVEPMMRLLMRTVAATQGPVRDEFLKLVRATAEDSEDILEGLE